MIKLSFCIEMDDNTVQNDKKLQFSVFFIVSFIESYCFYRFKWIEPCFYRASINGLLIILLNDKGHFSISAGVCCTPKKENFQVYIYYVYG